MEDFEWQSIMSGSFANPEMARKLMEDKRLAEKTGETVADAAKRQTEERSFGKAPDADPEIRSKIIERAAFGDDDIRTLSDIAEDYEEDGERD